MERDEKDSVRSAEAEQTEVADGAARVHPPRGFDEFPVVGIGASAGGLEAFTQLLKLLPSDTGMAFVLIQHLDPAHSSFLPEALAKATAG